VPLLRRVVITEGCLYLAERAQCYWLLNLYASHLISIDGDKEPFNCLKLVTDSHSAIATIDDGNGNTLRTQAIEYTDFPLDTIKLFACWSGEFWVVMLPTEY
jgi:hypothetical protein